MNGILVHIAGMAQYREPNQYYLDQYDRQTIEILKQIEKDCKSLPKDQRNFQMRWRVTERGIHRAREKDEIIKKWISDDELKDKLVKETLIPEKIRCNNCNSFMQFEAHLFEEEARVLFLFKCPSGHVPKKIVYPDGREQILPKPKCKDCGYEIIRETIRSRTVLKSTYTCTGCGKIETDQFELKIKPQKEISEKDRAKYCSFSPQAQTLTEGLKAIYKLKPILQKSVERNTHKLEKIEKPNIPQLEHRLCKIAESLGFIKFEFEKPEMGTYVTVIFSAQDPSDRSEKESIKTLSTAIKHELFATNWRLMTKGIEYRLGFLTGQLRAFEQHEDLMKIAKEISSK